MFIQSLEEVNNRKRTNQKYSLLLERSEYNVNSSEIINIILLENMWTNPLFSRIDQIIEKIRKIESGSIIIYTYGITINEIIPILNYESKNDIIEYLELEIPQILSCKWSDLKLEKVIETIEKDNKFAFFTEKKIILS
jgi:hypothetical protein